MHKNTVVLVGILLILLTIIMIVTMYKTPANPIISSPAPVQQASPVNRPDNIVETKKELKVVVTEPELTKRNLLDINEGLFIIFSLPVSPFKISYKIEPYTRTAAEFDSTGTRFMIRGDPFWPKGQDFKLTIKSTTEGDDKIHLDQDYILRFRTDLIPEPY